MKIKSYLLLIPILLSGNSLMGQSVPVPSIEDTICVIGPYTDYYYIVNRKDVYSDSLMNVKNAECILFGLDSFFTTRAKLSLIDRNLICDNCLYNDLIYLDKYLEWSELRFVPFLPSADSILKANNAKYVLVVVSYGFRRSKENYNRALIKDTFFSMMTLGNMLMTPYESSQTLKFLLYNCVTKQIILYRPDVMIDSDPDSIEDVYDQIQDILKRKFRQKKR